MLHQRRARNFPLKQSDRKFCATVRWHACLLLLCSTFLAPGVEAGTEGNSEIPDGVTIDRIVIDRQNIFNPDNPGEDNRLYRLINRLHVVTLEKTVRQQLLFESGEPFDGRLIEESERILRGNKYLYDASITPRRNETGGVDVEVVTRDVWTLMPEISISRGGGENKTIFGIEESNLFGTGQRILLTRTDDVDRTSKAFEFTDRQIAASWVSIGLRLADNSDGHSRFMGIAKPFHALDARWSAGASGFDDERRSALYSLGDEAAEYRHERSVYSAFGGVSAGLIGGWVRRWTFGVVSDDNRFSAALNPTLPQLIPPNRKLVYPYIGFEILEDRFQKSSNTNQIERSEDFYLGTQLSASLGWADTDFGADRDALIYSAAVNTSFGSLRERALLLSASARGRVESGNSANASTRLTARYYSRQSEKRLFFVLLDVLRGHNIDFDAPIEIGGDSGLRGYPLRYQSGDSRILLTFEQRYFTDWYPFRLFRVGGAVFVDVGRTWGDDPLASPNLGWLRNVGFGLRFAPTRIGTRKLIHLDIAFPLDGDPTIDDVQVSLEAKRSF